MSRARVRRPNSSGEWSRALTLDKAAALKNCHRRTIEAMISRGELEALYIGESRLGGFTRVTRGALRTCRDPLPRGRRIKWLKRQRRKAKRA